MSYVGQSMKRFEDPRLVTGKGTFVGDLTLPDMLHAAVLRSQHAHARLRSVDVAAARAVPGVVTVLTGADIAGVLPGLPTRAMTGERAVDALQAPEYPLLPHDKVCYVGQPIAVVVAHDPYVARDAVGLITVDYEPLVPTRSRCRGAGRCARHPCGPGDERRHAPAPACRGPGRGLGAGGPCRAPAVCGATHRASPTGDAGRAGPVPAPGRPPDGLERRRRRIASSTF